MIGVVDGPPSDVFGHIEDVAVSEDGDVFVLDNMNMEVCWFARDGTFMGRAGRGGSGPGEFRAPMGVEVRAKVGAAGPFEVEVLDMAHRRISAFAPADSGLVLIRETTIAVFGTEFCRLGDEYFVLANDSVGIVNVFDSTGALVRRFAEPIGVIPPDLVQHRRVLREGFARGRILCLHDVGTIVVLPLMVPWVRAFTPEGQSRWSVELSGYHEERLEPSRSGRGIAHRLAATGFVTSGQSIHAYEPGTLLVSLTRRDWENEAHELRILHLGDGRETGSGASDMVFAGRIGDAIIGYVNEPYPRVIISRGAAVRALYADAAR